MFIKLQG